MFLEVNLPISLFEDLPVWLKNICYVFSVDVAVVLALRVGSFLNMSVAVSLFRSVEEVCIISKYLN